MLYSRIRRREVSSVQRDPLHPHPILDRIFASRAVANPAELDYSLGSLSRPDSMHGAESAAKLLADALMADQSILIVGDFDADGATSSALAVLALSAMGGRVDYLVPNRFDYGYGLTPEIVAVAEIDAPDMLVTVDNGISSIEGVVAAKDKGMSVIITDHHLPGSELPIADVIVNPNQADCDFPSKNLAGVGVIFYVLSALRSELRNRNWFTERELVEPNMADFLDLVALGTVADVVPLDVSNRTLVSQGLARIRAGRCRPGITALLEVARRDTRRATAADLAFAVGPRLNAAGRLDDMSTGIECLLAPDAVTASRLAAQLDEMNRERRSIEADMQRSALSALEDISLGDAENIPTGLCLFDPGWHQGVIGILASRVKERYHRPVIAFAEVGGGLIKGSARSVPGLHIRDALDNVATRNPGLLDKFGGHAMAAGLSLRAEDYPVFAVEFDEEAKRWLDNDALQSTLLTDGELTPDCFSMDFANLLYAAGPWGQHFPEPLFEGEFNIVQQRLVGEKHLKLVLEQCVEQSPAVDAIAFNIDPKRWPNEAVSSIYACFRLGLNHFRGQTSLQLTIEYLEPR